MSIRGWNSSRPFWSILDTKENKAGTTTVSKYDYLVNAIGQRSNVAQTGTAFAGSRDIAWGYDPLGQVTSADSTIPGLDRAYQFDLIGNRLKTADSLTLPVANNYTPNALNQYTAIDTLNPVHDDDGNMTAGPLPANVNANSTLIWDGENRLIQAQVTGGATVTFIYDSQSRRIAETVGTATKITVYDGWNPIAEYWRAGLQPASLAKSFIWGMDLSGTMQGAGGVGGLLAVTDSTGTYYPTYDGNGNVSEYLDSTGAVVAHYEYDPFGKTTVATGPKANDFAHRFSTKPLDATTGLYYYAYRYYDPATGRWPSRDPIGERGGLNLYGMVGNNALNRSDILGLQSYESITQKSDNCYYIWIPILLPKGEKVARPVHAAMGHRPSGSDSPVTIFGTDMDGNWHDEGTYDPKTGKYDGGKQGKLYECCCLTDEEYERLKTRINDLRSGKIPEGSTGAGGDLPNNDYIPYNDNSPSGVPYNCATATSMATSGLGCASTSNTWNQKPSDVYPEGAAGLSDFWRTVMEQYKQMEAAVMSSKCKLIYNGVPAGNPYK